MNTWSLHSRNTRRILFGGALALIGCLAHGAEGATFTVNDPGDEPDVFPGDGVAETSPGSAITTLRSAIEKGGADAAAALEIVVFNAKSQARIKNAQITLTSGGTTLHGTTDSAGRLVRQHMGRKGSRLHHQSGGSASKLP